MTSQTDVKKGFIKKKITSAHVFQSGVAAACILVAYLIMHTVESGLTLGPLGPSAFIAFTFPHENSSRPRLLIGGYCIGVVVGLFCKAVSPLVSAVLPTHDHIPICALALFLSMILMTALDFQHPSSSALAMAVSIAPRPVLLSVDALCCIALLCAVKELFKKRLRNL